MWGHLLVFDIVSNMFTLDSSTAVVLLIQLAWSPPDAFWEVAHPRALAIVKYEVKITMNRNMPRSIGGMGFSLYQLLNTGMEMMPT